MRPTCNKCGGKLVIKKVPAEMESGTFTIKGELIIPKKDKNKLSDGKVKEVSKFVCPKCD